MLLEPRKRQFFITYGYYALSFCIPDGSQPVSCVSTHQCSGNIGYNKAETRSTIEVMRTYLPIDRRKETYEAAPMYVHQGTVLWTSGRSN